MGQPPFDRQKLCREALDEILRTIRETEPPCPSARLTTLSEGELRAIAICRQTESTKLPKLLRRDLDWIVMKAMEKDRTRRYETATGFARDIERFLKDEPILARPPGVSYRLRKFVRRNRLAFFSASTVLLAVLVGLGVSLYLYFNELRARHEAQASAIKSQSIKNFLEQTLEYGPAAVSGEDIELYRGLLARATRQADKEFTNQPDVAAELFIVIGNGYRLTSDFQKADAAYREADQFAVRLKSYDGEPRATILTLRGVALGRLGRDAEAERLYRQSLTLYSSAPQAPPTNETLAFEMLALTLSRRGDLNTAESMLRDHLNAVRKTLSPTSEDVCEAMDNLANVLQMQNKLEEAEVLYRQSLEIYQKIHPANDPLIAREWGHIGKICLKENDLKGAEQASSEALTIDRLDFEKGNPEMIPYLLTLSHVRMKQGRRKDAENLLEEAVSDNYQDNDQWAHPYISALKDLSKWLREDGDIVAADALSARAQKASISLVSENPAPATNSIP